MLILAFASGPGGGSDDQDRWDMVEKQIVARGISDKAVLEAMLNVPRHEFVPEESRIASYKDNPIPIGSEQTISQPYMVSLMTSLLKPAPGKKILEIGTGSGYQTAVLKETGVEVYTIEIISDLADRAHRLLEKLGYAGINYKIGDGYEGWHEHAPYDGIIVTAAPEKIPDNLLDQLNNGGKMVIPVGADYQELLLIEKTADKIRTNTIIPVRFVPMTSGDA